MTPGAVGVYNEDGGMVDADAGVAAFLAGARSAGADVREGTHVERIDTDGYGVRIETAEGEVRADRVVVAAGAWTTDLLRDLLPDAALPIRVTRQSWLTFRPDDPRPVGPDHVPVWCDYDTLFYGFPDHGPGLKIADDSPGQDTDPDAVDRRSDPMEEQQLTEYLRDRFPSAGLSLVERGTCLYTLTPDEDFVLGPVPGTAGRVVAAVGLNHAFKFAPVIGRILADLATTGATPHPIDRFRVDRFAPATAG
jgi:sarcosine oxidase